MEEIENIVTDEDENLTSSDENITDETTTEEETTEDTSIDDLIVLASVDYDYYQKEILESLNTIQTQNEVIIENQEEHTTMLSTIAFILGVILVYDFIKTLLKL